MTLVPELHLRRNDITARSKAGKSFAPGIFIIGSPDAAYPEERRFRMEDAYVLQLPDRKFSDLYLCFCGYGKCSPLHSFGPGIRSNYLIHYILEGKGRYQAGGKWYVLQAGQGFLIEPGMPIYYEADEKEPWTYLWVGFHGQRVREYLEDVGFDKGRLIYHSGQGEELKELVLQMLKNYTITVKDQFLLESCLYRFFSILARDISHPSAQGHGTDNLYVKKALGYIQDNYGHPIKVSDIAEYVCINRSYLYTLFREHTGSSPREYLSDYRLVRAAELLTMTDLSVESVAYSCGYLDTAAFGRAYKRKYQTTPLQYRRKYQQEQEEHRRKRKEMTKEFGAEDR